MKREQSLVLLEEIKNVNKDFDLELDGTVLSHAFIPGRLLFARQPTEDPWKENK